MLQSATQLEYNHTVEAGARTMHGVVAACFRVATLLERARKQAKLTRPRGALDAVDEARRCLTAPLSSLLGVGFDPTEGGGGGGDGRGGEGRSGGRIIGF